MHISLSWNGARAQTTFWTGNVYRTDYGPCVPKHKKYAPQWSAPQPHRLPRQCRWVSSRAADVGAESACEQRRRWESCDCLRGY